MNNRMDLSTKEDLFDLVLTLPHPVREKLFVELAFKGYFGIESLPNVPWDMGTDITDGKSAQDPLPNQ